MIGGSTFVVPPLGGPADSNPSWGRGRRGFTRTDLLMVVVLGAMLAVLLGFGLSYAKERVRRTRCLNNVQTWAQALILYAADNEFIPREGHRTDGGVHINNWANVADPAARDVWYNALPPYVDERPASTYASWAKGERPKFYENRLFHCPSARFQAGVGKDNEAFFSLGMNSKLIRPENLQTPECSIRFDTIQRPAQTVSFLDARVETRAAPPKLSPRWGKAASKVVAWLSRSRPEPKVDVLQTDQNLGQPSVFASRFAPRHRGGGNLAFCDGHAEWQHGTNVVKTRPGRNRGYPIYPDGQILWCADPDMDPNQ